MNTIERTRSSSPLHETFFSGLVVKLNQEQLTQLEDFIDNTLGAELIFVKKSALYVFLGTKQSNGSISWGAENGNADRA